MSDRTRRRSRRRRRDDGPNRYYILGAALIVLVLPLTVGTMAFTQSSLPRGQAMDVVSEGNGALDLDTVSDVNVGNRERLVTIVNRLNRSTTVTVSVTSGPGTLYTSSDSGSTVSFSLSQAASNTVDIEAGGTGGDQITYQIEADGTGLTAVATRTVDTLSTGQAAPGYPSAFNDGDNTLEANENNTIPPNASSSGNMNNFANMQVASDNGATATLEGDMNIGVVTRNPPTSVSDYEMQIRYVLQHWSAQPTVNVVDDDGNVIQSETLASTNGQMETATIPLSSAANSYVNNNGDFYVTYTSSSGVWGFSVDYQRIQEDPPPPEASFTTSCDVQECTFDGSASTGYSHPIVEYQWDFGDGTTTTTTSSVTSHTYASNGTYNVKLTVVTTSGETDTTSNLTTVGTPQPTFVPPDVYDDIESWGGEAEATNEDNSIPPPQPEGGKVSGFTNMNQVDDTTATLPGGPFNIGVATRGVSGSGSDYELFVRYALENWEDNVDVLIVDDSNNVLQTQTLTSTGGSLTNETISLNSAAETYVKDTGNLYVRYDSQGSGWVELDVDAHLLKVIP